MLTTFQKIHMISSSICKHASVTLSSLQSLQICLQALKARAFLDASEGVSEQAPACSSRDALGRCPAGCRMHACWCQVHHQGNRLAARRVRQMWLTF